MKVVTVMSKSMLIVVLVALMFVATALAAEAYPTREIKYVRVGQTPDGQPLYVAFIQLNYMDAALAAHIFGGQALAGQQYGPMTYRPTPAQRLGGRPGGSVGTGSGAFGAPGLYGGQDGYRYGYPSTGY